MDRQSFQYNIANFVMPIETGSLSDDHSRRFNLPLLIETILVMAVTIGTMKVLSSGFGFVPAWLMTPGILIVAAFLPIAIKREGFRQLGFNVKHLRDSLVVLGGTCIAIFPLTFCGLWILKSFKFDFLLWPVIPRGSSWVSWFFYQFMYIALAEEVFFRGYVQSNILGLTKPLLNKWPLQWQWMGIGMSAACFAAAHVIFQEHIVSALTFLPGLVLGWLFIRTKSLLAPILFHGLANAFYLVVSIVFV